MYIRQFIGVILVCCSSLMAVAPADRVPADVAVYIEGAPLNEGITAMHTLVSGVAGEGVWSIMAANLEQKSGINLLDPTKLEELGINTKSSWGLALNLQIESSGNPSKPEFVMIIPVQNNAKFYDFIKSKITEDQTQAKIQSNLMAKEIEPGRLLSFGTENDPGYMMRSDDAVLLGNKLDLVKIMSTRVSQPVANAQFYAVMKTHLWLRNQNKQPLATFYLNPKFIVSALKVQTEMLRGLQKELNQGGENAPIVDENSPYFTEIRDNLQSSGGALVANGERVSFYFSYKYKEGYLNDTNKIYPRIIQIKASPLASDTVARNPVHYTLLKLNVIGVIELFKSLSPVFNQKYGKAVEEYKTNFEIDFEKQVLETLRGNYNFQVLNIPAEAKMKDIAAWEAYGAFGIKPGTAANWLKLFKTTEKIAKKTEAKKAQKTQFAYEESEEGNFVIIKSEERISGKKRPITIVFLIREQEIIVSNSKANALKATRGTETTLSERLTKLPYDAAQGIFFLDLQQIFKAISATKENPVIKNYANVLEKMKFFSIISSIQGDFATAETTLQLRK